MSTLEAVLLTIHLCGFTVAYAIGRIGVGLGMSHKTPAQIFLLAFGWEILLVGSFLGVVWEKINKLNL